MTKTQEILPNPAGPHHKPRVVVFLAYRGMGLLDITGPQTVFWSAAQFLEGRGAPGYVRHTVSLDGGVVMTTEGIGIDTRPVRDMEGVAIDTIVVPGAHERLRPPRPMQNSSRGCARPRAAHVAWPQC